MRYFDALCSRTHSFSHRTTAMIMRALLTWCTNLSPTSSIMAHPNSNTGTSAAVLMHPNNANALQPIAQTLYFQKGGFKWHRARHGREHNHHYCTPDPFLFFNTLTTLTRDVTITGADAHSAFLAAYPFIGHSPRVATEQRCAQLYHHVPCTKTSWPLVFVIVKDRAVLARLQHRLVGLLTPTRTMPPPTLSHATNHACTYDLAPAGPSRHIGGKRYTFYFIFLIVLQAARPPLPCYNACWHTTHLTCPLRATLYGITRNLINSHKQD